MRIIFIVLLLLPLLSAAQYTERTNPAWTAETVTFRAAMKAAKMPLTYEQLNAYDAYIKRGIAYADTVRGGKVATNFRVDSLQGKQINWVDTAFNSRKIASKFYVDSNATDVRNSISSLTISAIANPTIVTTSNLFNGQIEYGKLWNTGSGASVTNATWVRTTKIVVSPNTYYSYSGWGSRADILCYTAGDVLISDPGYTAITGGRRFLTPANTAYVAFNLSNTTQSGNGVDSFYKVIQLNQVTGSTTVAPAYEQYYLPYTTWQIKPNSLNSYYSKSDVYNRDTIQMIVDSVLIPRKPLTILKNSNDIYIRSKYSNSQDIVQTFNLASGSNAVAQPRNVYLIGSTALNTIAAFTTGTLLQTVSDDATPIRTSNFNILGANHGLVYPVITATHDKTSVDSISEWTDGTRNWYITGISGNQVSLMPKTYTHANTYPALASTVGSTLTHVSGATHASAITVSSQTTSQGYPVVRNVLNKIYLDNVQILADGLYIGSSFKVVETYDVVDPTTTPIHYPMNYTLGTKMCGYRCSWLYAENGACTVDCLLDFNSSHKIAGFGFIQAGVFQINDGATKRYAYMPKVQSQTVDGITVNLESVQNFTTFPPTTDVEMNSSTVDSVTNPPDLYVQFTTDNSDVKKHGFAHGISQLYGVGKKAIWGLTNYYWRIAASGGKSYPYVIVNRNMNGDVLHAVAYRHFFNPALNPNATFVTYHKEGNDWILQIAFHSTVSKERIVVGEELFGKKIEILEQLGTITLHTNEMVPSSGLVVSATTYGYIKLRLTN